MRVDGAQDMRQILLQIIPEVPGYQRLGGLGGVEAVHWLYQGGDLTPVSHPVSQDCLEGILHIVDVEFVKFMFLRNGLEDTVESPGVLGGDLAESGVAGHPASTGSDLQTVEPAVHVFILEVFPVESLQIPVFIMSPNYPIPHQRVVSISHVGPEEPSVYQTHKNNMSLGGESCLEELESGQCIVIKQLSGSHVLRILSASTHVIT